LSLHKLHNWLIYLDNAVTHYFVAFMLCFNFVSESGECACKYAIYESD